MQEIGRDHWSIENGQYYRRDRTQDEDRCPVRETIAARNLSLFRSLAIVTPPPPEKTLSLAVARGMFEAELRPRATTHPLNDSTTILSGRGGVSLPGTYRMICDAR